MKDPTQFLAWILLGHLPLPQDPDQGLQELILVWPQFWS